MNYSKVVRCILLLLFFYTSVAKLEVYHKISPVASCQLGKTVNVYQHLDECIHRCSNIISYSGAASIQLMQDYSKTPGPSVIICQKIRISQKFEETWTFSQITHTPVTKLLTPSKEECTSAIEKSCSDYKCQNSAPSSLKSEFSYASVLTKEEDFLIISAHHSSIIEIDSKLKLLPMFSSSEFLASDGYGEDDKGKYFWDKSVSLTTCPLTAGIKMGCDEIKHDKENYYICGGSRLVIDKAGSVALTGACKDINRSPGGILYKVVAKETSDDHYKNQKIGMTGFTAITGDAERVRVLSQHAVYHIDADLCSVQCELSGLELRVGRKAHTLIRSGHEYMLIDPRGHGYPCDPITHCKLNKPIRVCGNPNKVSVHCNGKDYYWDPLKNYVTDYDFCTAPHPEEKIQIHIGNKLYDLEDDLHINVSDSDPYTHKSRSYLLAHESMFTTEDINEIRTVWVAEKKKNHTADSVITFREVDHSSIGLTRVFSYAVTGIGYIARAFSHAEMAVLLTLGAIFVGYVLIKLNRNTFDKARFSPVNNNHGSQEMVWM
ncbi:TPA_asm: G [Wurfbainia alphacytorhabdovirus 1]|nr:TPA_asm: G [Wurfbainia alphacytorhabdovirus 1]